MQPMLILVQTFFRYLVWLWYHHENYSFYVGIFSKLISLRYQKLQSWKKLLKHFTWFKRKVTPVPTIQCWSESCFQKPLPDPQHWQRGARKDFDKSKNLCFLFEQCHASFSILVEIYMNSCNTLHKVCQLFFSMIVASSKTDFSGHIVQLSMSSYITLLNNLFLFATVQFPPVRISTAGVLYLCI